MVKLRNQAQAVPAGDVAARGQAEGSLGAALGRVIALAEAYPDSKANQVELQRSLETIEGEIQNRGATTTARPATSRSRASRRISSAGQFGFAKCDIFEITNEADRAVPMVKF